MVKGFREQISDFGFQVKESKPKPKSYGILETKAKILMGEAVPFSVFPMSEISIRPLVCSPTFA
jgi:hypothetical protein